MTPETALSAPNTWSWPDSLDALQAAPANHELLLENDQVRVVHTRIRRGETVPVHTHRWPCVLFILSWSDLVRRDQDGNLLLDTRQNSEPPQLDTPSWQEALPPHSVENVGDGEINTVQVEIKSPRSPAVTDR
jgi:hypothetical protein